MRMRSISLTALAALLLIADTAAEEHEHTCDVCGHVVPIELAEPEAGFEAATVGRFTLLDKTGSASWLVVRFRFADDTGDPPSVNAAAVVGMLQASSGGRRSIAATTVGSVLLLPHTRQAYIDGTAGESYLTTVRSMLKKDHGIDWLDFTYVSYVARRGSPFITHNGGSAFVGGQTSYLSNGTNSVVAHELGHNHGLYHSSFWNPSASGAVIGSGTASEYGHSSCIMGNGSRDFCMPNKWFLNWLQGDEVELVTTSGRYQLHAHDLGSYVSGRRYGLVIDREVDLFADGDSRKEAYSVEFRQNSARKDMNLGATILGFEYPQRAHLLDMTPESSGGTNDASLRVGRTYADTLNHVYITSVSRSGSGSGAVLAVQVNLGPFPGNRAPSAAITGATQVAVGEAVTLSCTASDPDGDELAYFWESEIASDPANAPSLTRSWSKAGTYQLRCVVSDMKGGSITVDRSIEVIAAQPVTRVVTLQVSGASAGLVLDEANGVGTVSKLGSGSWSVTATSPTGKVATMLLELMAGYGG